MSRIPLLTPETLTPEQRRVYEAVVSGPRGKVEGPLRAALHRPELAEKWQELGELLRYRTGFPQHLCEVAILVTAQRWRCQLEWHLHAGLALEAGLEREVLEAIRLGRRPVTADPDILAIHDFAADLQENKVVAEPTYQSVLGRWGVVGVVELTALVGYYTMVAMTLNAHEFPLPEGVEPPFGHAAPAGDGAAGEEHS